MEPVRFWVTWRNWSSHLAEHLIGRALKTAAFAMRMEIRETLSLIYCVARR